MKHKNHCKSVCWLPALAVLFILAGVSPMGAHGMEMERVPIKPDIDEVNRELGIMARVLEASLDGSGMAPWQPVAAGTSAFDSGISLQYIPKVCAIFTIPVNFPIFDPAKQPEQKETPGQEEPADLWEKYAREGDQTRELKMPRRPHLGLAQLEGAIELRSVDDETKRKELFKWGEEHKQRLRDVLLETLAHYGHRLEHLNTNEEKFVFMVQAPSEPLLDLSDPVGATYLNFLMAQRLNNKQRILVAGKSSGQVNHYILVISNAKLNAAVTLEDLESSVAIEEYYY